MGGMRLAFLYEQISLTSDSSVASIGGYMTLLVVIFVFLLFYLLDRKCLVVCINLAVDINICFFVFAGMDFGAFLEHHFED